MNVSKVNTHHSSLTTHITAGFFRSIAEENVSRIQTEPWFTCTLQNKEQCFHAKNGGTATQ